MIFHVLCLIPVVLGFVLDLIGVLLARANGLCGSIMFLIFTFFDSIDQALLAYYDWTAFRNRQRQSLNRFCKNKY